MHCYFPTMNFNRWWKLEKCTPPLEAPRIEKVIASSRGGMISSAQKPERAREMFLEDYQRVFG